MLRRREGNQKLKRLVEANRRAGNSLNERQTYSTDLNGKSEKKSPEKTGGGTKKGKDTVTN